MRTLLAVLLLLATHAAAQAQRPELPQPELLPLRPTPLRPIPLRPATLRPELLRPEPLSAATLCEQAILTAERIGETPPRMLSAIARVEAGRPDPVTGALRPWPWTINAEGAGYFFATKVQAMAAVQRLQAQGVRSIDVGCMQVNLMHHPDAFATLGQAFDPHANAAYAVHFLNELYRQTGSWPKSIAAYHSQTPAIGADYQRRVLALWRQQPLGGNLAAARYASNGLIYGAFGPSGRVYGAFLPKDAIYGAFAGARP